MSDFIPHGHCYLWSAPLVWTEVGANLLIGIAYLSIAATLAALMRRLEDVPFQWMYHAFAIFIFACGITHFFDILVIWEPYYWADATVRAVTAVASVATAVLLPPLVPKAVDVVRGARAAAQKGIRLESAVDDLEDMYRQTKELEQRKTEFFASVSHELRTPLTLILGESRDLLESELDEETRQSVQAIADNSRILLKHVEDLLDIASFEAGETELDWHHFDLVEKLRRTVNSFEGVAREYDVDFRFEAPDHIPVRADDRKLESVVLNLVSNAFKFTPDGGTVVCELSRPSEGTTGTGDSVVLSVRDSGPGVPEDRREEIFGRFRQLDEGTDERFGGTGLGLVVVRNYVELHGGSIEVGDAPEGGAEFTVRLPVATNELEGEAEDSLEEQTSPENPADRDPTHVAAESVSTQRRSPTPETLPPPDDPHPGEWENGEAPDLDTRRAATVERRSDTGEPDGAPESRSARDSDDSELASPRVLVVEDNVDMNDHICGVLPDDYATLSVYDGEQALDKIRRHRIDAILTDLMMPKIDGVELVERLSRFAEIPILVITARVDDRVRRNLLRKGANDFLPKPFAAEELRLRVSNLVAVKRTQDILQHKIADQRESIDSMAQQLARRSDELEEALTTARIARNHAERASEMKTEFLGMISHELRTPLTALQMQLHLLEERVEAPADMRREIVERASRVLDRLLNLVENLLEKAALESGQLSVSPTSCDLGSLTEEIVEENRIYADRDGLEIQLDIEDDLTPLETDRRMLRMIVSNLVRNAIKYTETGTVSVSIRQRGGESFVEVRDTGPGIEIENPSEIFEAFRRSDDSEEAEKPGVGLGLSVVRDFARALGGTIRLDSTPGEGSRFRVAIPTVYESPDEQ